MEADAVSNANRAASDGPQVISRVMSEVKELCEAIRRFLRSERQEAREGQVHMIFIQEAIAQLHELAYLHPPQEHDRVLRDLIVLRGELEEREAHFHDTTPSQTWTKGNRGAWTLQLDMDLLLELMELRFADADICTLLGCSRSTLKRRRAQMGIKKKEQTEITDEMLCALVRDIRRRGTGEEGERAITGMLRSLSVHVSRARLRQAVQATDPLRQYLFRRHPVQRRQYKVPFVNSLWHIDGHHKLIRWRLVIHGAIDGKSRVVTFLKANSNNMAVTVGDLFLAATERYGWPSRVRGDHGGENLAVKMYMERKRGHGRGSFIQGSSVHNQRIERLWVDLQRWTTSKYRALFEKMEEEEYFNADDPVDLWTLHFVFLPQLNQALQHFQRMWNNHPMRTAGLKNKSPLQLYTQGIMEAQRAGWSILHADEEAIDLHARLRSFADHGIGPDYASMERESHPDDPHVEIPALENEIPPVLLDQTVQTELRARVGTLWPPPPDMGVDVFRRTLILVKVLLRSPMGHAHHV